MTSVLTWSFNFQIQYFKFISNIFFRFIQCDDDENMRNETTVKYELILRKWQEFNPANEFRCFVKHNQIIGKIIFKRKQKLVTKIDFGFI